MDETFIQSSAQDGINRSIWVNSRSLQRSIPARATSITIGAQQAMPLPCHHNLFSAENPLPWVPDLVGSAFSKAQPSILVVGSSYNGFLRGYTDRRGTMSVDDYVSARNAADAESGIERFSTHFVRDVCDGDKAYYARIRAMLQCASARLEHIAVTDLCKASFVERTTRNGRIIDAGSDALIEQQTRTWQNYVQGANANAQNGVPLPYEWIVNRLLQAQVILALGKLAEYGVIKILRQVAPSMVVNHSRNARLCPNADSLSPKRDWVYEPARAGTTVRSWLESHSWWNITDPDSGQIRAMLPCIHPSAWKGRDADYAEEYGRLLALAVAGARQN